ncbi:MAG TPA: hypothetical protein VHV49_02530 [Pseudonocardiaceae bacterium]|jgi:hypothetical protein|nr:hypothetical protein [Pseudonocardiaceae bacterium]
MTATKQTGLGDQWFVDGWDLSGDTNAITNISCPTALLDVTGINQLAFERRGGRRDGDMAWVSLFNPGDPDDADADAAHPVLSLLPRTDAIASYFHGGAIGNVAASCVGKQLNYDPSRGDDGSLTFKVDVQASVNGLEWGKQLTPGKRTDTAATNGTELDNGAATTFGAQAYLQAFSFTGTSAVVKVQHSTDAATWTDLIVFATLTAGRSAQRAVVSNVTTVDRHLRAVTTGTFTSLAFAVMVNRNKIAGVSF